MADDNETARATSSAAATAAVRVGDKAGDDGDDADVAAAASFTMTRDRLLQLVACNAQVEQAVHALEEAHVHHIAALRRAFAIDGAQRMAALRHDAAERQSATTRAHERAIAQLTRQYEQQLQKMTASHNAEVVRLRASMTTLRESHQHADGVIAELHRSHASELARVQAEAARALSVKDSEVALLRRQLRDEAAMRACDGDAAAQRSRAAEATVAQLRRELNDARVRHNAVEAHYCDELVRFVDAQQSALRVGNGLLDALRDTAAALQVSRSKAAALLRQVDNDDDNDAGDGIENGCSNSKRGTGSQARVDTAAAALSSTPEKAEAALSSAWLRVSALQARRARERALMHSTVQQLHDLDDALERVMRAHDAHLAAHAIALRTLASTSSYSSSSSSNGVTLSASRDTLASALRTTLALITPPHA